MKKRCLICYNYLDDKKSDYHAVCSKKFFGMEIPPELNYTEEQLNELGLEVIKSQTTLTGVQKKLSLHLPKKKSKNVPNRFTIVGLWGGYILKPPTEDYEHLPEVEDLTMHLAEISKIEVVPHCLIRMQSGSLAFIAKRIDRIKNQKQHMEDMCQLTERLTEEKYNGSYEQIAKVIQIFSNTPGLDLINFYEIVLFSFLSGNADMHLKNFSLIRKPNIGIVLSPAYDLIATKLVNPSDREELALTLNGKKNRIKKSDFVSTFNNSKLEKKQQENIFRRMIDASQKWPEIISKSFLNKQMKDEFIVLIKERIGRINAAN